MLSKSIDPCTQSDWDEWLPMVQFSYNTSIHSSTGIQPFELQFGRESKTLLDLIVCNPTKESRDRSAREFLKDIKTQVGRQIKVAQEMMAKSMLKQKACFDHKGNFRLYEKGDLVMLREYACKKGLKPKLMKERWSGPWRVVCRKSDVTYRITKGMGRYKRKVVVHHNRLKSYVQRPAELVHVVTPNNAGAELTPVEEGNQLREDMGHQEGFTHKDFSGVDDDEVEENEVPQPNVERNVVIDQPIDRPEDRGRWLRNRANIALPVRYR